MVVLHGSWLEGALHLWAERWPAEQGLSAVPSSDQPVLRSPYDVDADALGKILARVSGISSLNVAHDAIAWLPTQKGCPVASRGVWSQTGDSSNRSPLSPWRVTALSVSPRMQFAVLGACNEDRRLAPGVMAGEDLVAWSWIGRYAGALVARKAFLPGLAIKNNRYEARWQPAGDGTDQKRLLSLSRQLPGVARCLTASPAQPPTESAEEVVQSCVSETVDQLVRLATVTTLSRAHAVKGRYFSAHDAWLAALRGDARVIRWEQTEEIALLAEEITAWRRPVDLVARGGWRLLFRLEEPAEHARPAGSDRWFLHYLAQSLDDEHVTRPLADVWRDTAFAHAFSIEQALTSLGQAAVLCASVRRDDGKNKTVGCALTTGEAYSFLAREAPLLEAAGFGVEYPAWWQSADRHASIALIARAHTRDAADSSACALTSLVSVDWGLALGDQSVTIDELKNLAETGERLVRFRDRWIELDHHQVDEAVRLWKRHRAEARSAGDMVRLMIGVDQDAHGIRIGGVVGRGWIERLLGRLRGETALEDVPVPAGFQGELRPYQQRGYSWLVFLRRWGFGACLADDMGLGKTIQALALLARERERGEKRPVLLVCPTSVIGNWEREAARFTPGLQVLRHHGPGRNLGGLFVEAASHHALVVTSFALLPRDYATLRRVSWAGIVLDEAQNIKNPDTRQAQAARALSADYRLALTGTPVENHVGDLWSIMDFLNPGLLGTRRDFRDRFLRPIQSGVDPQARDRLRRAAGPFVLRRLKTDRNVIADLPEKIEGNVYCTLTREQASLYAAVLHDLESGLGTATGVARRGLVLATLTRLKQVCNHPAHYLDDALALGGRSGKLDRLIEMLDEVISSGDRALIFTQFAEMGFLLQRHITQTFGFEPPFLYGGVPQAARERMIAAFQSPGGPSVFILSLRAGGTGLNLTAATHVFHFDRWWNPAVENQATDRAFRIGQTRNVMVHKLVCSGTLEDRIDAMIASKRSIAEEVVGAGEIPLTELSDHELKRLLALAPEAITDDREAEGMNSAEPVKQGSGALTS